LLNLLQKKIQNTYDPKKKKKKKKVLTRLFLDEGQLPDLRRPKGGGWLERVDYCFSVFLEQLCKKKPSWLYGDNLELTKKS
jgi:hypothetical protein